MQRVSHLTRKLNLFGAGKPGYTDGSPGVEVPTVLDSAATNAIQEELASIVELAGAALNPASYRQAYDAIISIVGGAFASFRTAEQHWLARQFFDSTDATLAALEVSKTAADDSAHPAIPWKLVGACNTSGAGYARLYTGLLGGAAQFAIAQNAYWNAANARWQKDLTAQASVGLFWDLAVGLKVSTVPGGTANWTSWPNATGDIQAGGFFSYATSKTRTSLIPMARAQIGQRSGTTGSLLTDGTRSFGWQEIQFPPNWVGGTLVFAHYQDTVTPSVFRLAERVVSYTTPGVPTMSYPLNVSGPAAIGNALTSLDLTAKTFSSTVGYSIVWYPGSAADQWHGTQMLNWADNGPRNVL